MGVGSLFYGWKGEPVETMGKRILVLGVGNLLLHDEGVGVRAIERLESEYVFSDNVRLFDGGTLGLRLLDPILHADCLIVVDAVQNGGEPGTIYRLTADDLNRRLTFKNSIHQLDLVETLAYAELLGKRPEAVIVGIEPEDISQWGTELTATLRRRFDDLIEIVLAEIRKAGGEYRLGSAQNGKE